MTLSGFALSTNKRYNYPHMGFLDELMGIVNEAQELKKEATGFVGEIVEDFTKLKDEGVQVVEGLKSEGKEAVDQLKQDGQQIKREVGGPIEDITRNFKP